MSMIKYIVRRLLITIPIMFFVLLITFTLVRMMPGNPFIPYEGKLTGEALAAYERRAEEMGFNKPIWEQFVIYVANLFQGNWGDSLRTRGFPVWDLIMQRFPITLEITIYSIFIASIVGIKAGVFSAVNRNNSKDTIIRFIAIFGVSVPVFWLGMLLQYFLSIQLHLFPIVGFKDVTSGDPPTITSLRLIDSLISGRFDLFLDTLWHLCLPVFCLSFITLASITRQSRSSMLEVLELDYIRSARAKGCDEKTVINKHALRNALIPTVTVIGLNFGYLLGGAVLTETTFNLNGFGMLMTSSVFNRDYFVINALVFITTLLFIMVNLITDIIYAIIDPRIRY